MERVSCPFDPVHTIEPRRLQAHIIKCKRNLPPNHDFVECKYYHLHYFRRSQMEAHYATCEHKLSKEAYLSMWESEFSNAAAAAPAAQESIPDWHFSGESWDMCTGTLFHYDQHKEKANHMTVPEGLSKAKRKEFREKERERLRELEEQTHKLTAKKEPVTGNVQDLDFCPVPRKPELQAVRGGCRIAAKFPRDLEAITEKDASCASTSYAANVKGKERAVEDRYGANDAEFGYQFSPEQFPELKQ